jgi:hypothetical protein
MQQGQIMGQGQAMGQIGKVSTQVEGDDVEAYSFTPPGLGANKGVSEANVYSLMGGIGTANTEEYQVCIDKLAVIERMQSLQYITAEEAQIEARKVYAQLQSATNPKRILGVLGKTRGKHLLNLFGFLAWDSFYSEPGLGQKVAEPKKNVRTRTLDELDVAGNRGYINR